MIWKKIMKTKLFLFISIAFLISCSDKPDEETTKPVPVKTYSAILSDISLPIYRSGVLAASSEARLSFKTGGIISHIYVDEGDQVKQGQVLATLNLSEINAQVKLAESGYQKAQRDLARIEELFRDSVATLEQKQDLKTAAEVAEARLRIAKFNLRHSKIFAPSAGRILKRFAEENELTSPGTPILYFGSSQDNWIIRLGVTDRDIISLQYGDSASVSFDAYHNLTFPASITQISESADKMSGTFEIELTLTEQVPKLASGFVAKAAIYPSKTQQHILIPLAALVEADKNSGYVYVVNKSGNQAQRLPVILGQIVGDRVIILSGIRPDTKIITEGSAYLTDQSVIKIVN
jgi:membrane fusion protein, multidrug efflux system